MGRLDEGDSKNTIEDIARITMVVKDNVIAEYKKHLLDKINLLKRQSCSSSEYIAYCDVIELIEGDKNED